MLTVPLTTRPGGLILRAVACVLLLAVAMRAGADVAVYQAVVPLAGPSDADRNVAFGDALRTAAVCASGRADAGRAPAVASAAADPTRYVQQYSMTADHMLKVGFDAGAMDKLLQQAGLPFWPLERPSTTVLLVVSTVAGGQRAVLASEHAPERAEVERAALARCLPVTWPQQPVAADQVRALLAGSQAGASVPAFGGRPLLVGVGSGDSIAWSFNGAGQSARAEGPAQVGVGLAADALAAVYAPASTRGTEAIPLRVGGVGDVKAYAGLLAYLRSLSLVRGMSVDAVDGHVVTLDVTLRGDLELLRRIAALDTRLVPAAAATPDGPPAPDFVYQP